MKHRVFSVAAGIAMLGASHSYLYAEAPGVRAVSLNEVFELVGKQSPGIQASKAGIDAAMADLKQAGLFPNPELEVTYLGLWRGEDTIDGGELEASLSQPLLLAGQRKGRKRLAEERLSEARAAHESNRLLIAAEAGKSWVKLLAAQEREAVIREEILAFERIENVVAQQVESGVSTRYDFLRLQVGRGALAARSAEIRSERHEAANRLAALLGEKEGGFRAQGLLADRLVEENRENITTSEIENTPMVQEAGARMRAGQADVDLAKRERWPVPELILGMRQTRDAFSRSHMLGLALPLPVFDHGQAQVARSQAEYKAAESDYQAVLADSLAALRSAEAGLNEHLEALAAFEAAVSGSLDELGEMAESLYTNGRSSIVDLLDAIRARIGLRMEQIDLLEAVRLAELTVLELSGRLHSLGTF